MKKITFWQYLTSNHVWLLAAFTGVLMFFWVYWLNHSGWIQVEHDILLSGGLMFFIWLMFVAGSYINWRKL